MLKRYKSLLKKDIITGYRNYFFYIVIGVALLFAGIINFVIPEDASIKPTVYYYSSYNGDMENILNEVIITSQKKGNKIYKAKSRDEVVGRMEENFNSIGMIIKENSKRPVIEFIIQGHENPKIINSLLLSMKDDLNIAIGNTMDIKTLVTKEGVHNESIPINKSILPLFILMEPSMLGFVLIAAMIFMEKEEGTIRAYNVSPGKVPEYLASKITLMLILGWISTLISTVLVVGLDFDFLALLLLVTFGSIFFTSLGLIIASFFENLSQSLVWIILISLIIGLPFVSYFVPSFAPIYIRILPTYPLMFAIREAIFPTGNTGIVYTTLGTFAVLAGINYILAIITYRKNLGRN